MFTTNQQNLGMMIACPSGSTPTSTSGMAVEHKTCEKCQSGYYSLGVQSACEQCSTTAEFNAATLHYSTVIDTLCEGSEDSITDAVTDTIRSIAESTDSTMSTVAIVLIIVGVVLLLAIIGIIIAICYCRKNKKCCFAPKTDKPPKQKKEKPRS